MLFRRKFYVPLKAGHRPRYGFITRLSDLADGTYGPALLNYLEGLFGFDSSKLHAYSSFFSKVELPDEAVEKIYTGIFNKFFPEFINLFCIFKCFRP